MRFREERGGCLFSDADANERANEESDCKGVCERGDDTDDRRGRRQIVETIVGAVGEPHVRVSWR